ncbi:class I SAM-dependent methyltransferase [Sphaerimonospora sp. CA-214678]|uniref:class I SAM-dependent methyltransferase n=1 Tax=Sphaerimonospora sp. CA-214678 TaxID=3240029 RepID=UPI003D8BF84A
MIRREADPALDRSVPDQEVYWNRWHSSHRQDADPGHSEFLRQFLAALPKADTEGSEADHRRAGAHEATRDGLRTVLELGCGQGHDAAALAAAGCAVDATDFALNALLRAREALPGEMADRVRFRHVDLRHPLPFPDRRYHGVYAYLSLHYFDDATTRRIFAELARVLCPGGTLAFAVKSVNDRLYGRGHRLGPDIYCLDQHVRHFFRAEYVHELLTGWGHVSIAERAGAYVGARGVDSFLTVIARPPE